MSLTVNVKNTAEEKRMAWRIGVDTGGTFTDVALVDERRGLVALRKVPSSKEDPSRAILTGVLGLLADHGVPREQVSRFNHGTTVAVNAVLEGTAARAGLLTTSGFRDVLELARQRRPHLYDMSVRKPRPVVPRELRLEVGGRLDAAGTEVSPVDGAELDEAIAALRDADVDAVAVCLLHSYADPTHEEQVRERLRKALPDVPVSVSSEVHPEYREYERFSTTAVNASLVPVMRRYLGRLSDGVAQAGITPPVRVVQSNGGLASTATAGDLPVSTLFSGPSAGVLGAVRLAAEAGVRDIITFDMGGTSTDVCLVRDGRIPVVHEREMDGRPIMGAMVDVVSVGSGGGSIAWVDDGGLLKVGPRSAGAVPGPVAYGRGGTRPTVSDADCVLGLLHPDAPLAGTLRVDTPAAARALESEVGNRLGLDAVAAADGVLRVLRADLVGAVRAVSVARGTDPRDFTLVPYGGAGPLHASALARELGIRRVLVPPAPGILCAYGALSADVRGDFGATCVADATEDGLTEVVAAFRRLEERAAQWSRTESVGDAVVLERRVELHYANQSHALPVPLAGEPSARALQRAVADFHHIYEQRYGYALPGEPVRVVAVRLTATAPAERSWSSERVPEGDPAPAVRQVFVDGAWRQAEVYRREALPAGWSCQGPAVVGQLDATTVVLPGQRARIDEFSNLIIEEAR
ncbi:hydantoinase/oxoprolinase family protein [Streptomyces sp. 8L]|uniref:hydantoinase/oxoprolinase family protein n=1 Tax=Streptomyces sp. 8L TaxID=2877242 RepID=UPI001CD1D986|nr:hydantoinase/oxoprolinase family protein [Streptomyces sp. 8L]MCA1217031.1 hydantoinase/oxoprolinase family protein [Streptomyces sp. 8L]